MYSNLHMTYYSQVIHDLMIAAEEDSKVRHELIKIYEKTITSLDSRSPDDPLIRAVSKCYNKTNVFDMLKKQKGKLDGEISRWRVLVLGMFFVMFFILIKK